MRVLVTASTAHLRGLEGALRERGHEAIRRPLTISEIIDDRSALAALDSLQWWLFPSRSAVRAWIANGGDVRSATDLAAVGPGTAAELGAAGARVAVVGQPATAEGLVERLMRHQRAPGSGDTIGAVVGERARGTLRSALAQHGVLLKTATLYRSRSLPWVEVGALDAVVVASPSAVAALPDSLPSRSQLLAIGPTTAASLRRRGWPSIEAREPSIAGVIDALERALGRGA